MEKENSTIDSVAASLIVSETPPDGRTSDEGTEAATDVPSSLEPAEVNEGDNSDADAGEVTNADEDEDLDFFSESNQTDDEGEQAQGADAETFEVLVDGQKVKVTLAELKKRYSGEAAIERRLQQATAARTEAETLKQSIDAEVRAEQSRLSAERNRLATALNALRATIAAPQVKRPDPALAQSNPNGYNAQLAAYNADQLRVQAMEAKLNEALQLNTQQNAAEDEAALQASAQKFVEAVPAMRDPKRAPEVLSMINKAAQAHGFTAQEVAANRDHRLYVLALKAGMYDRLIAKGSNKKVAEATAIKPKGGDAAGANGAAQRRTSQLVAKREAQAAKTGSIDDVALSLIVPAGSRK